MGLYEYKLAAMVHNERNLQNALAAADSQIRETRLELLQAKAEVGCVKWAVEFQSVVWQNFDN